jgi:hypothetical protein
MPFLPCLGQGCPSPYRVFYKGNQDFQGVFYLVNDGGLPGPGTAADADELCLFHNAGSAEDLLYPADPAVLEAYFYPVGVCTGIRQNVCHRPFRQFAGALVFFQYDCDF